MQDVAHELPGEVPFWAVDTACLYPMQLTARAPAKAYIFRQGPPHPLFAAHGCVLCSMGSSMRLVLRVVACSVKRVVSLQAGVGTYATCCVPSGIHHCCDPCSVACQCRVRGSGKKSLVDGGQVEHGQAAQGAHRGNALHQRQQGLERLPGRRSAP